MIVTERLMRAGSFSLSLAPDTPDSVRSELREALGWTGSPGSSWNPVDGHIQVCPTWVPVDVMSDSLALYSGRFTDMHGVELSGVDIGSWMGTGGLPSDIRETALTNTTADLEDYVDDLIRNGITKGTVTEPGGTYTSDWYLTSPIEMLDHVCNVLGAEWRINPDFTLDAAAADTLFASPPTVLVTDEPEGESGSVRGVTGRVDRPAISVRQLTSKVIVAPSGEGAGVTLQTATAGSTVAYGPGGSAATLEKLVDAPADTNTGGASVATSTLNLFKSPRFAFDVTVESDRLREHLEPGDELYVYDERSAVYDQSNTLSFRGRYVFPVIVRVESMRWNVTKGHGVYLRRNSGSGATYTDLTQWVVWSSPGASLEVGAGQGWSDRRVSSGQSRFNTAVVERLNR